MLVLKHSRLHPRLLTGKPVTREDISVLKNDWLTDNVGSTDRGMAYSQLTGI